MFDDGSGFPEPPRQIDFESTRWEVWKDSGLAD